MRSTCSRSWEVRFFRNHGSEIYAPHITSRATFRRITRKEDLYLWNKCGLRQKVLRFCEKYDDRQGERDQSGYIGKVHPGSGGELIGARIASHAVNFCSTYVGGSVKSCLETGGYDSPLNSRRCESREFKEKILLRSNAMSNCMRSALIKLATRKSYPAYVTQ